MYAVLATVGAERLLYDSYKSRERAEAVKLNLGEQALCRRRGDVGIGPLPLARGGLVDLLDWTKG